MTDAHQRRESSRFPSHLSAVLHVYGADYPCVGEELSRTGMLLVGELPRETSPLVRVSVETPMSALRLELTGRVRRAETDDPEHVRLAVVFEPLDDEVRDSLEALISRLVEGSVHPALDALASTATAQQMREALEQMQLPHRIALAQRALPREREILIHDPSPQVIDALARNPQLLPNEIRALLRLPNLLPSTLESMARDPRWTGNEELTCQIAGHHNTSFAVAERLAARMSRNVLQKLILLPGLNAALRTNLVRKLGR